MRRKKRVERLEINRYKTLNERALNMDLYFKFENFHSQINLPLVNAALMLQEVSLKMSKFSPVIIYIFILSSAILFLGSDPDLAP